MLWWNQLDRILCSQEAQVFVLYGDVDGYPIAPLRGVESHLVSWRRAINSQTAVVKWSLAEGLKVTPTQRLDDDGKPMMQWDSDKLKDVPAMDPDDLFPEEGGDFAALAGPSLPSVDKDWKALDGYLRRQKNQTLVILRDVDLLLGGPSLDPQGRSVLSYLRMWQSASLQSVKPEEASRSRPPQWAKDWTSKPHIIIIVAQDDMQVGPRVAHIRIPLPNFDDRLTFLRRLEKLTAGGDDAVTLEDGLTMEELARISGALNLRQVEDVWYRAAENGGTLLRSTVQDRKDALITATYGGVMQVVYPREGFERIVGFESLKRYFSEYVLPLLRAGSTTCPKGCVLAGPPGTGKTVFASALAAALQVPRVDVVPDRIKDKYVGESNKRIARLCEGIRALAPCVVFIDEIDKILPTTDDNTGVSQEILGQLQTFLSEIPRGQAFFVATTNYPERVPRALLRPGRFEEVVPMLAAHLDGVRDQLVSMFLGGYQTDGSVNVQTVGDAARDYTGADLERLVIVAHRNAVMGGREVITQKDFDDALSALVPTTSYTKEMAAKALEFCTDRSHVPESARPSVAVSQPQRGRRAEDNEEVIGGRPEESVVDKPPRRTRTQAKEQ